MSFPLGSTDLIVYPAARFCLPAGSDQSCQSHLHGWPQLISNIFRRSAFFHDRDAEIWDPEAIQPEAPSTQSTSVNEIYGD